MGMGPDADKGLQEIKTNHNGAFAHQTIDLINGLSKVFSRKGSLLAYLIHMTLHVANYDAQTLQEVSICIVIPLPSHYLKIIMDSTSKQGLYQNEITWQRTNAHNDAKQGRKAFGNIADIIFFYTKSEKNTFHQQYLPNNMEYVTSFYKYQDKDGRKYRLGDLTAREEKKKEIPITNS